MLIQQVVLGWLVGAAAAVVVVVVGGGGGDGDGSQQKHASPLRRRVRSIHWMKVNDYHNPLTLPVSTRR